MPVQTHPNFKSVVENVQNAETIRKYVGDAIASQGKFEKRMPSWEINEIMGGCNENLQKFKIDLEKIDRLYHVGYDDQDGDDYPTKCYELIARMQYYNNGPIYFTLSAIFPFTFEIEGNIYVSRHVNSFMNLIFSDIDKDLYFCRPNKTLISQSLRDDGIYIFEKENKKKKKNASTLLFLCHETISKNKNLLQEKILPKILHKSVIDFIKTEEAKRAFKFEKSFDEMDFSDDDDE